MDQNRYGKLCSRVMYAKATLAYWNGTVAVQISML